MHIWQCSTVADQDLRKSDISDKNKILRCIILLHITGNEENNIYSMPLTKYKKARLANNAVVNQNESYSIDDKGLIPQDVCNHQFT